MVACDVFDTALNKLNHWDFRGPSRRRRTDGYLDGSCMLAMVVGPNARALLSVTPGDMSRDEGCDLVEDIARKVEPLLPEGSE